MTDSHDVSTSEPPGERSTSSTIVGGSLTILGSQVAIKVVAIVFNIAVIRYLGDEQYGKYAICVAFGGLFAVMSDLGLAPFAVKRIARDHSVIADLFSNLLAIRIMLSLGVVALTSGIAWALGYEADIRLGIFIAALALVSYAVFGLTDAVAIGRERFRMSATLQVSNHVLFMAIAAILVAIGTGFLGLLVASALAPLIVAALGARRTHRETPVTAPLNPGEWVATLRAALPFAAIGLALAVSYRADTVILSGFVAASTIGLYAVAYNLIFTVVNVSHSINLVVYPVLTRERARSSQNAEALFRDGLRYLFFLSLPFAVFMTIYAEGLVTLLYGQQFAGAALPLAILCWVIPLMFLGEFLGYVAIVVDRESLAARANWVSSGTNVAGNLAFIPFFGIVAAAIMTVVTEVMLVVQYLLALRVHGVDKRVVNPMARIALASAALAIVSVLMRVQDLHVIIAGPIAIVSYFMFSALFKVIGPAEIRFLRTLITSRVRSRRVQPISPPAIQ